MFGSIRRRRIPMARQVVAADVLAGEFVQCLWGGPIGFLRSKEKNGYGLVLWIKYPGCYEIIDTKLLKRAPEPRVHGREAS